MLWIIPALALAALMTGGPPGLVVAGVAVLALLALPGVPVPRWVVVALAVPALVVAARHYLG